VNPEYRKRRKHKNIGELVLRGVRNTVEGRTDKKWSTFQVIVESTDVEQWQTEQTGGKKDGKTGGGRKKESQSLT